MVAANGVPITVRRVTGVGPGRIVVDATALAVVTNYSPGQLQGGIQQGDLRADLANDLDAAAWPLPVRPRDQVLIDTTTYTVIGATPVRTPSGNIGWTLWLRGGP